ncbi:GAF domain-containing protein, partial [Candidatus Latescibacterota bacterium]
VTACMYRSSSVFLSRSSKSNLSSIPFDSVLFAPMIIDKKTVGVIGLANKPGGFNQNDVRIASAFGELAAISLNNTRNLDNLADSEKQFHELFNHMNSGVAVYQAIDDGNDFVFKDINTSGEQISHVKRNNI